VGLWRILNGFNKVQAYLDSLPTDVERVSSRSLKKSLLAESVAPRTWALIIRTVHEQCNTSKKSTGDHCIVWRLEGQSLVRVTAQAYGFTVEDQQSQTVAA
jgi:hypothetical protein